MNQAFEIALFIAALAISCIIYVGKANADTLETAAEFTEILNYVVVTADLLQTRQIRSTPGQYEGNYWLHGQQPSDKRLAFTFGVQYLAIYFGNRYLNNKLRVALNTGMIIPRINIVKNNYEAGLTFKW